MRILRTITVLTAVLAIVAMTQREMQIYAEEPAEDTAALEQEVRRLIGDLAGETHGQRAAAEKRLLELGSPVLSHLPAAELLPSNSVRETVRRIRLELERRKTRESVLPARVTFDGRQPLTVILAEITRQTGNVIDGRSLPENLLESPVELKTAAVPFWQVVDDLSGRQDFATNTTPGCED